jgi:hypothetical protein
MGVRKKLVKKRSLQLLVLIHTTLELQVRLLGGLFSEPGEFSTRWGYGQGQSGTQGALKRFISRFSSGSGRASPEERASPNLMKWLQYIESPLSLFAHA